MEHYLHRIIDSDDMNTRESKHDHNEALINNTQIQNQVSHTFFLTISGQKALVSKFNIT